MWIGGSSARAKPAALATFLGALNGHRYPDLVERPRRRVQRLERPNQILVADERRCEVPEPARACERGLPGDVIASARCLDA